MSAAERRRTSYPVVQLSELSMVYPKHYKICAARHKAIVSSRRAPAHSREARPPARRLARKL